MMEEGYKQMERSTIPKILRSNVLLIVTAVVWKTIYLGLEQVTYTYSQKPSASTSTLHDTFFLAQKELLINVLSYECVFEKKLMTVL